MYLATSRSGVGHRVDGDRVVLVRLDIFGEAMVDVLAISMISLGRSKLVVFLI